MTTEEMIECLRAFQCGRQLERKYRGLEKWEDAPNDRRLNFDMCDYRIKPAERKPREWRLVVDDSGRVHGGTPAENGALIEVSNSVKLGQCRVIYVREFIE